MNRAINLELLNKKIDELGDNGVAKVAVGADLGVSTVQAMRSGNYPCQLRAATRRRLSNFLQINEDELFPLARKSAS